MTTLYDLLGARADDDAEALKKAFRKAVKATHPDLHTDDPDALSRFRMIVAANAILSDTERRQAYDRMLQFQRQQLHSVAANVVRGTAQRQMAYHRLLEFGRRQLRSKRTRSIISHVAVAAASVALTIGWQLLAPTAFAPITKAKDIATAIAAFAKAKDTAAVAADEPDTAGGPVEMAAVRPGTRPDTTSQDESQHKREDVEVPDKTNEPSTVSAAPNGIAARVVAGHEPAPGILSNDAKFYRKRGIAAYRSGDFPRAIAELDEAIRLDPTNAPAYNIRGNALDETGAFERALADYDQAIRIDPNNPLIFHDRAILWRRKGELDKALVDLDRAIRFGFSDANIYCDRGLVWYERGRYDRAIADFNQAIKIDPNFADACINRGIILHRKSEFNRTLAAVNQAIRVDRTMFNANRRANLHP